MKYTVVAALLLVAGSLQAGSRPVYEYKLYRVDENVLGFSCNHGGIPVVREDRVTLLTCEK